MIACRGRRSQGGPGADVLEGPHALLCRPHGSASASMLAGDTAAGAPGENDQVLSRLRRASSEARADDVVDGQRSRTTTIAGGRRRRRHSRSWRGADTLSGRRATTIVWKAGAAATNSKAGAGHGRARRRRWTGHARCGDDGADVLHGARRRARRRPLRRRATTSSTRRGSRATARRSTSATRRRGATTSTARAARAARAPRVSSASVPAGCGSIVSCPRRAPRACVGDARLRSDGAAARGRQRAGGCASRADSGRA